MTSSRHDSLHDREDRTPTSLRSASPPASRDADASAGPSTRDEDWLGRVIDERYRIIERIGEGGMGAVFVAEHLKLQKPVALKVIHSTFVGNGEIAARFAREAMVSAQVEHPNVASALDYGTLPEGGAYLVMQLVRGQSLHEAIGEQGGLPWPLACDIAAQVADALHAAHGVGIVHRDLKPDNVLLIPRDGAAPLVKVLDFGIARVNHDSLRPPAPDQAGEAPLTRLGTVIGTPGYMAPEQAMGDRVDRRADLYALGVVIWEMLVGRQLFANRDLTSIVSEQLTQPVPSAARESGDASIPAELESLLARLLARDVGDRPRTAAEARDGLRALSQRSHQVAGAFPPATTGTHPRPLPGRYDVNAHTVLAPTGAQAAGQLARPGKGPPWPIVAVALAGLGLITVAITVLGLAWASRDDTDVMTLPEPLMGIVPSDDPPPISPEVAEQIERLLQDDAATKRRAAAEWLRDHQPDDDVPQFAALSAELELARSCAAKSAVVAKLAELGDERALPALDRLSRRPRRGCGFLNRSDCWSCLREPLAAARADLARDADPTEMDDSDRPNDP